VSWVFAHEHRDVEERPEAAEVTETTLVGGTAQLLDVRLEIERGPVQVADAHGRRADPEGVSRAGRDRYALALTEGAPLVAGQGPRA
jgi:hypothetical protein